MAQASPACKTLSQHVHDTKRLHGLGMQASACVACSWKYDVSVYHPSVFIVTPLVQIQPVSGV